MTFFTDCHFIFPARMGRDFLWTIQGVGYLIYPVVSCCLKLVGIKDPLSFTGSQISLAHVNNIALEFGNFTVTWYGILVATGFLAGYFTAFYRAPKAGIASDTISEVFTWIIIGGIVGARLLYVVTYWDESFAGKPILSVFKIWEGGLVFFGGLIGGTVATILFCRIKKISAIRVGDALAPSLSLGHAFGRIGCLMAGCCFGKQCTLPWAITFPEGHSTHPHAVHPVQIYESILNFLLFGLLIWIFKKRKYDGQVLGIYCIGYSIVRFIVEFFRGDYPEYAAGVFTQAHMISVFLIVLGVWILFVGKCRGPLSGSGRAEEDGRHQADSTDR